MSFNIAHPSAERRILAAADRHGEDHLVESVSRRLFCASRRDVYSVVTLRVAGWGKPKMVARLLAVSLVLASSPACAMTGAELLQSGTNFASGYILGVVDHRLFVFDRAGATRQTEIRECIVASKMTTDTLYSVVIAYLRNHPDSLQEQSFVAVLRTLDQICPKGNQ
jgi:hypothetical protein